MSTSCSHPKQQEYKNRINKITSVFIETKYEEALLLCNDFIKDYPRSSFGYILKGHALNRLNRSAEAIDSYRESLSYIENRDTKNMGMVLESIGNAYLVLTQLENALDFYNRALREDPERTAHYTLNIARINLLKGELEKAKNEYLSAKDKIEISDQAAQKINPKNKGTIYSSAAFIAYQLGRNTEALEYALKYDEAKNNDASKLDLAFYFAKLGDKEKARRKFHTIKQDNCDPLEIAKYYLLMNQKDLAIRSFNDSYNQQKTPLQLETWQSHFKLKWPRDDWATVREQEWFKSNVIKSGTPGLK
jgi:tetratricopeptide (TPR) repeat protein